MTKGARGRCVCTKLNLRHCGCPPHSFALCREHSTRPLWSSLHISYTTPTPCLPPWATHGMMGCYAPVFLCALHGVCRAAVGVNVYQCQSLTIVGMLLSLALICRADLYFVFPLSLYLTGLSFVIRVSELDLWVISFGGAVWPFWFQADSSVIRWSFHWKVVCVFSEEKIFGHARGEAWGVDSINSMLFIYYQIITEVISWHFP